MILRNDKGQVTAFVCSRPAKCAYCDEKSSVLCDFVKADGKTCDAKMCRKHSWNPLDDPKADYCRMHRRVLEAPSRDEALKSDAAKRKRSTLVYFAESKYSGYCRDRDCSTRWSQGEPCYWDRETRDVFCVECGEGMGG
jgi:hypothetical protein